MESFRGQAPLKKGNLPRQKGWGTSTYIVRGCCLLWLGSTRRFLREVVSSGGGVNPGNSKGVRSGTMLILDVFRNFCSFLFVNFGTTEELPRSLPYIAPRTASNQPWVTTSCELPGTCCVLIGRSPDLAFIGSGLAAHARRKRSHLAPCLGRMMKYLTDLVKYVYSKNS